MCQGTACPAKLLLSQWMSKRCHPELQLAGNCCSPSPEVAPWSVGEEPSCAAPTMRERDGTQKSPCPPSTNSPSLECQLLGLLCPWGILQSGNCWVDSGLCVLGPRPCDLALTPWVDEQKPGVIVQECRMPATSTVCLQPRAWLIPAPPCVAPASRAH